MIDNTRSRADVISPEGASVEHLPPGRPANPDPGSATTRADPAESPPQPWPSTTDSDSAADSGDLPRTGQPRVARTHRTRSAWAEPVLRRRTTSRLRPRLDYASHRSTAAPRTAGPAWISKARAERKAAGRRPRPKGHNRLFPASPVHDRAAPRLRAAISSGRSSGRQLAPRHSWRSRNEARYGCRRT